jgi:hypothetical protein
MFSKTTIHLLTGAGLTGLYAALALGAQHVILYRWPLRLSRPTAFCIGLLTLLGFSTSWACWAREQTPVVDPLVAALAFWIICGAGGLVVVLAYWARQRFGLWEDATLAAGFAAGSTGEAADGPPHDRAGQRARGGGD